MKLLELLLLGDVNAYYLPSIIKFKDDLLSEIKPTQNLLVISNSYWRFKPLPHYDYNAIHFGESNKLYFTKHVLSGTSPETHDMPPEYQFWFGNVQIEANPFEKYIMPLIYRHFPLPVQAGLNRAGNKYIINFGEDKNVEVKQSIALYALKTIFLHTNQCTTEPRAIDAVFIRGIITKDKEEESISRHSHNDLNEEPNHLITETNVSIAKIKGIIGKIRKKLMSYWNDNDLSIEGIKALENEIKSLTRILSSYSFDESYKTVITSLFNYKDELERSSDDEDEIQHKLKSILDDVLPFHSVESQVNEVHEDKKEVNALWYTIKSGLEVIKPQCPHLYFHLLGSGTSDKNGGFKGALRMDGNGLIYQPSKRIVWNTNNS
ncbi:MAG: hypothetical protein MJK15_08200 [Colwellia sp.]|nr:hypothetical protein [Colwellia sp.]